ncbi:MAG: hypothetical protein WCC10_08010 [Tumebacillaceae bacterium]
MLNEQAQEALNEVVKNWRAMQSSDMDSAGDDADRFERSFYLFVDELRAWMEALEQKPKTLDQALQMPEIEAVFEELDAPLHLNLETELEVIVQGLVREEEVKYD